MIPRTLWAAALLTLPALCLADSASDLAAALAGYPSLSTFRSFVTSHADLINTLVTPAGSSPHGVTVLAPSNQAFADYPLRNNGTAFASLSDDELAAVLAYHVLDASLTAANFSGERGITVPTRLQEREFNNKAVAPVLADKFGGAASGQVLFAQARLGTGGRRKRQDAKQGVELSGGLGTVVSMTVLDVEFGAGSFVQMVDGIMTLPDLCTKTIAAETATSKLKDAVLNSTIYGKIDITSNVTCLAPSNEAFEKTGKKPPQQWNGTAIEQLVLSHVFPQVLYSDLMQDGLELTSLGNTTVRVSINEEGDIFFNDAKVVSKNLLTVNGVMHVVDRVISPTPAASTTTAGPDTPTPTKPNSGPRLESGHSSLALVVLAAFVGYLI